MCVAQAKRSAVKPRLSIAVRVNAVVGCRVELLRKGKVAKRDAWAKCGQAMQRQRTDAMGDAVAKNRRAMARRRDATSC